MKIVYDVDDDLSIITPLTATTSKSRAPPIHPKSTVPTISKLSFNIDERDESPQALDNSQGSSTAKIEEDYEELWASEFLPRLFLKVSSKSHPWASVATRISDLQALKDEIYPDVVQVLDKKSNVARVVSFTIYL